MYYTLRKYDTDIHVYEFDPNEEVFTLTAEEYRTPLSKITHDYWDGKGKDCLAKINAGYFSWNPKTNTSGVDYRDEGFMFSDTTDIDDFIEVVYSDKKLHLIDGKLEDIKDKFPNAELAFSAGPPLVDFGVAVDYKKDGFEHLNIPNPRTILGQKKSGIIVLVVAEGRNKADRGLTYEQEKEIMLDLECYTAVNLDGGGSSEIIVDGIIKNYLPYGERHIGTALLVYGEKKAEAYPIIVGTVKISRNFSLDEIACRCCGEVKFISYKMMEVAQSVRDHFSKPIRLVGYRCPAHNKEICGAENSGHIHGTALDISAWNNDITPEQIYEFIEKFETITGIGIYDGHVHIDDHHDKRTFWDSRS